MNKNNNNKTNNTNRDKTNRNNITPIVITVVLIIGVSILFFAFGNDKVKMGMSDNNYEIYEDLRIKTTYTENGEIKLFALAKNNELAKYDSFEGKPIPETGEVVIGYAEAQMMKEELLFTNVGDNITDLFGVNITIVGILKATNSPVDDIHFMQFSDFDKIQGEENKVFIMLDNANVPKVFYQYSSEKKTIEFNLTEGNMKDYTTHTMLDKKYQPLIIGYAEAQMMREEKLFEKMGDRIEGLFGQDFIVIGIISQTNTSLDMMHLTPISKDQFAAN